MQAKTKTWEPLPPQRELGEPMELAHSARALVQPGVAPSRQEGGRWAKVGSAGAPQAALLSGWVLQRATRTETLPWCAMVQRTPAAEARSPAPAPLR
jgi:hypothetical protein